MPGALIAMASEPPVRNLSWGELDWVIECALDKMRRELHYLPTRIIPIGGGGIIPASILAYRLYKKEGAPIEMMSPVYARSYGHDRKQHPLSMHWPEGIEKYDSSSTLFVDDIVDTGATWDVVRWQMPKSSFFTVVTKISGPMMWGTLDTKNHWWVMPWEKS